MIDRRQVQAAIALLQEHKISVSDLLLGLLQPDLEENACTNDLIQHSSKILSALLGHPASAANTRSWAQDVAR